MRDEKGEPIPNPLENVRATLIYQLLNRMHLVPRLVKNFINDMFYPLLKSLEFKVLYGLAYT